MNWIRRKLETWSPTFSPTVYKGVLAAIVSAAFVIPLGLVALPYIEFFNGMAVQPKGKTQQLYGRLFGEELVVNRPPVPGTVPRHYEPYPFPGADERTELLAAEGLIDPTRPTRENLRRGRELYNIFCIVCHGPIGLADGPVVGPNRYPAPPSLHETARNYTDARIVHIISQGKGLMPLYGDKIEFQDRWAVVYYVRALQRALAAATQPAAAPTPEPSP